ncbi:MAG: DUF488 family protein [Limnochordaceae bacterium]|nr:DUF488 family protein [Limnochordaceae bacterium]
MRVKRIYDPYEEGDGERILVDGLWPRGISREQSHLAAWARELAPSAQLRQWFGHDPSRWDEFRQRYRQELQEPDKQAALLRLVQLARSRTVTLLYAARDKEHNQAVVLRELLAELCRGEPGRTEPL